MNGLNLDLMTLLNAIVLLGAAVSAIVAVQAKRLLDSIIGLGAAGSFIAVEFLFLQAPDVAIAEAAVGAVLGSILYVIALRRVMRKEERK